MAPNASNNVIAGFRKCGIIPIDKDQVLKMLPAENSQTESQPDDQAALERQQLDNPFRSMLKSMRYEDAKTAKRKRKSKINVPAGKSIGREDFENSESSQSTDSDDDELEVDPVPEVSDSHCDIEDESNVDEVHHNIVKPYRQKGLLETLGNVETPIFHSNFSQVYHEIFLKKFQSFVQCLSENFLTRIDRIYKNILFTKIEVTSIISENVLGLSLY